VRRKEAEPEGCGGFAVEDESPLFRGSATPMGDQKENEYGNEKPH
jgi:hypothetical protein